MAGDLGRHNVQYDVTVMKMFKLVDSRSMLACMSHDTMEREKNIDNVQIKNTLLIFCYRTSVAHKALPA